MDDAIEELTYSLLQGGDGIRKRAAYHPPPQRDLQSVTTVRCCCGERNNKITSNSSREYCSAACAIQ